MQPVGIIVGHGYVKAVSGTRSIVFPSVAAPAIAADFETTLGAGARAVRLNGSGDWLVGNDALTFAPSRLVSILDRDRYLSPSFIALLRRALELIAPEYRPLALLTGMPHAWFADSTTRGSLDAAVRKATEPWGQCTVKIAPEAAGVFYATVFTPHGTINEAQMAGEVGVVDAGYRDINVARFSGGRYVGGESVPGGMAESLREIKRLISQAYRLELPLHEVDACVREGSVMVEGKTMTLPEGTDAALQRSIHAVVSVGRSLWPNGGRGLRTLLLGGGGAHVLATTLAEQFPQLTVVPDPQLAGARGFAAAAAAQLQRGG